MKEKKSPKVDLQNKRGIFFQIGLIGALIFTVCIFGWSRSEVEVQSLVEPPVIDVTKEIINITRPEPDEPNTPRQALQISADIINIVTHERQLSTDFEPINLEEGLIIINPIGRRGGGSLETADTTDIIFIQIEDMPQFMGGDVSKFRTWIMGKIKYPEAAANNMIQGRVTISFVVEKNGYISNIDILGSPDRSLSEEAIRIIQSSPQWTPGKQRGTPVRVRYNIPIDFTLN